MSYVTAKSKSCLTTGPMKGLLRLVGGNAKIVLHNADGTSEMISFRDIESKISDQIGGDSRLIFAPSHGNVEDDILQCKGNLPGVMVIGTQYGLTKNILLKMVCSFCGEFLRLDRQNSDDRADIIHESGKVLSGGKNITIFPEGAFDNTPNMSTNLFHGIFKITKEYIQNNSQEANKPIFTIPVSFSKEYGQTTIHIGAPIDITDCINLAIEVEDMLRGKNKSIDNLISILESKLEFLNPDSDIYKMLIEYYLYLLSIKKIDGLIAKTKEMKEECIADHKGPFKSLHKDYTPDAQDNYFNPLSMEGITSLEFILGISRGESLPGSSISINLPDDFYEKTNHPQRLRLSPRCVAMLMDYINNGAFISLSSWIRNMATERVSDKIKELTLIANNPDRIEQTFKISESQEPIEPVTITRDSVTSNDLILEQVDKALQFNNLCDEMKELLGIYTLIMKLLNSQHDGEYYDFSTIFNIRDAWNEFRLQYEMPENTPPYIHTVIKLIDYNIQLINKATQDNDTIRSNTKNIYQAITDIKNIIYSQIFYEIRRQKYMGAAPINLNSEDELMGFIADELSPHMLGTQTSLLSEIPSEIKDSIYDPETTISESNYETIRNLITDMHGYSIDKITSSSGFHLYSLGINFQPNRFGVNVHKK